MPKITFTCLMLLLSINLTAQTNLDSLSSMWQNESQNDSTRCDAFYNYIRKAFVNSNQDTAIQLAQEMIEFGIDNQHDGCIAKGHYLQGISFYLTGKYFKALDHYSISLAYYDKIGDERSISIIHNNSGVVYKNLGEYPRALENYKMSLAYVEKTGDKKRMTSALSNIGIIYGKQGQYKKAHEYLQRVLNYEEENGDPRRIAMTYGNIGNTYMDQKDYPNALDYLTRSSEIFEQIDYKRGLANTLNNIGNIYSDLFDYEKASDFYAKSLKVKESLGDKYGMSVTLTNIGRNYFDTKDYQKALTYCQKGFDLGKSLGGIQLQKECSHCLYDTYKAIGNSRKALEFFEILQVVEDSLHSEETSINLQKMEFQKLMVQDSLTNVEKARLIQIAHDEELRQEENTRNISFGVGLFFVLLAGGFFSRWRYVKKSKTIIESERDRSEQLLLNILPAEIAAELKENGKAAARDFDMVSILFTDFKGFTEKSAKLSATDLVSEINECFEAFDGIIERNGIEKIKTIGDAYMAAGGLPVPSETSVKKTVLAALEMQEFISNRKTNKEKKQELAFDMRVGIHSGPVVAGIVGIKKFQYDVWGDTVNTASRIESSGIIGKVNISQATYELLKNETEFEFEYRGKIKVKGKGEIAMWFIEKA